MTTLSGSAFSDCYKLQKVTLPSTLTTIDGNPFSLCESLRTVTINDNPLLRVENGMLYDAGTHTVLCGLMGANITECIFPEGVEYIADFAFDESPTITTARIPEGVKGIGKSAFSSCSNLGLVTLPASLESVGGYAFSLSNPRFIVPRDCYAERYVQLQSYRYSYAE